MLELIRDFAVFAAGLLASAAAFIWRHRRLVSKVADWAAKAFEDGRITKRELAELLRLLGEELERE